MNSRLTGKIRNVDGSASSIRDIADDKGFPNKFGSDVLTKLADYEDLEEQGLLLRLPCKVGDSVYKTNSITLSEIVEIKIESIFITESKINISGRTTKMKYSFCCSPSDIGKTVFLTQAEAEQKLKEMESD